MSQYEIYPDYSDDDGDKPLFYVAFHKWDDKSKTIWQLFQRQFMYSKEEWKRIKLEAKNSNEFCARFMSNEVHPWNLGEGVVNENENAMDMDTRKFLKFMVDALNDKVGYENEEYLRWKYSSASRKHGPDKCNECGKFSSSRVCWDCSQKST